MSSRKVVPMVCLTLAIAASCFAQKLEFSIGYSYARAGSTFNSETVSVPGESPFTTEYCSAEGRESFGPNFQQFFCRSKGMSGFDASATWNLSRFVGIKGALSGHSRNASFVDTFAAGPGETFTADVRTKDRIYSLMGGVQLRDNESKARVRPFAHVLAGAARQTVRFKLPGVFDARSRETAFAMRFGAGIDVRMTDRIDFRVIEVNYNPIVAGERPLSGEGIEVPIEVNGRTADNFTFGVGLVFRP